MGTNLRKFVSHPQVTRGSSLQKVVRIAKAQTTDNVGMWHHFVRSDQFDYVAAFVVLCNMFMICVQTDALAKSNDGKVSVAFLVMDYFFFVLYLVEMTARISVDR